MTIQSLNRKNAEYGGSTSNSPVSACIRALLKERGYKLFENKPLLKSELDRCNLPPVTISQLWLIFSASDICAWLINPSADFNLVDADNMLHNIHRTTGLRYDVIQRLLSDILSGIGLDFTIEQTTVYEGGVFAEKLHVHMPSELAKKKCARVAELMSKKLPTYAGTGAPELTQSDITEAATLLRELCDAGVPAGMYMAGLCHMEGHCGYTKDIKIGRELIKTSASRGVPEAAAAMGDLYYNSDDLRIRDYTLAHKYYTMPGAAALNKARRSALIDICKQESANKTTLFFGAVIALMQWIFALALGAPLLGEGAVVWGVITSVLSTALCAAAAYYHVKMKPYNGIRALIAAQFGLWMAYMIIAILG